MRLAESLLVACSLLELGCHPSRHPISIPPFLNEAPERPSLLVLGVFHFDDAGLDAYKPRFTIDVMSPERQREIEGVVDHLAGFRPTKVAVEVKPDRQRWLDSLYQEYVQGRYTLGKNEIFQLGFRLARRLGHNRVYAADAQSRSVLTEQDMKAAVAELRLDMDTIGRAIESEPWNRRYRRLYEHDDSIKAVVPLATYLDYINSPERLRVAHGAYIVGGFKLLGPAANYLGPDDATEWYNRNLRIYSNLQSLAKSPGDRVLLIIGAGHVPILRFLGSSAPDLRLMDARDFLH
jgi:hypothetical protein